MSFPKNVGSNCSTGPIFALMRRIVAFLLTMMIAVQTFYNLGVTIYWLANRPYIAAELCENRDRPEMHCEGKCFLKKKLTEAFDKARGKQKPEAPILKKGIELAEQLLPEPWPPAAEPIAQYALLVPTTPAFIKLALIKAFFHPPDSAC